MSLSSEMVINAEYHPGCSRLMVGCLHCQSDIGEICLKEACIYVKGPTNLPGKQSHVSFGSECPFDRVVRLYFIGGTVKPTL